MDSEESAFGRKFRIELFRLRELRGDTRDVIDAEDEDCRLRLLVLSRRGGRFMCSDDALEDILIISVVTSGEKEI